MRDTNIILRRNFFFAVKSLSNHCQLKMNAVTSVYQCLFCPETFSSASLKDDHTLEHFSQEMCSDCNRNLIRIGNKLYTIHDAVTCVKKDATSDEAVKKAKPIKPAKPSVDEAHPGKNQYPPDVEVQSEVCIGSSFEEILIKLEGGEEVVVQQQQQAQVVDVEEVHGQQEIIEVDVEEENPQDPEYIIIDLNDIPLVREQPTDDQAQSISQPNTKFITKCDVCDQEFDCVFFLESHRKLKHPTATVNKIDNLDNSTNVTVPIVKTPSKGTKSIIKKSKPKTERPIKSDERLECLLCNKLYKTELSLRAHIDTIHDPSARKWTCKICGSAFFREPALQKHHENQHLNLKKFTCGICGAGVKSKIALERHMFQHTGKKPFKCTWDGCKKTFTCTANRDEHLRSHTGERPFVCDIDGCKNSYIFAADIRKHKYKIHNIFPKKFPCPMRLCTQVFPQRGLLKKHMKKHSVKNRR